MEIIRELEMRGLDSVRVDKKQLLATLRQNHEKHKQEFAAAIEGWKAEVIGKLEKLLAEARDGTCFAHSVSLHVGKPEDHSEDYVRVIKLLEYSLDQELELSTEEFNRFVLDNWQWTQAFKAAAANYSNSTRLR